jgi:hypothetical protein
VDGSMRASASEPAVAAKRFSAMVVGTGMRR